MKYIPLKRRFKKRIPMYVRNMRKQAQRDLARMHMAHEIARAQGESLSRILQASMDVM